MASTNTVPLLYKDKPLFGLDIGSSSIKVMQINQHGKEKVVSGYGVIGFDAKAIKDGEIVDFEIMAKAVHDLFSRYLIGEINTRRVAISIPASKTFSRTMQLPKLGKKELDEAIRIEAEQYIPVPLEDLYLDYEITQAKEDGTELLLVAVPKKLVDSYLLLGKILDLQIVAAETTISASGRLLTQSSRGSVPTILIDFGSASSDITVFDKSVIVTGTTRGGGENFTDLISKQLGISSEEARVIKVKYGLEVSKKQAEITEALNPLLESLLKELRRMIRYYDERSSKDRKIAQIVTTGGGANMPGLNEWLTDHMRMPVRPSSPWEDISFAGLQPPSNSDRTIYATATGLALVNPRELFR